MGKQKRYEFKGELFIGPRGGYYIDFPFDAEKEFGTKKQVKVKVWYDGHPERKSLLPKGDGNHWLSVAMNVRQAIGKVDGDKVDVMVERDLDPRTAELPEDLEWLLDNEPDIRDFFMKQGDYTRSFFCNWISQARDPDTRVNRINQIFKWLRMHRGGQKVAPFQPDDQPASTD